MGAGPYPPVPLHTAVPSCHTGSHVPCTLRSVTVLVSRRPGSVPSHGAWRVAVFSPAVSSSGVCVSLSWPGPGSPVCCFLHAVILITLPFLLQTWAPRLRGPCPSCLLLAETLSHRDLHNLPRTWVLLTMFLPQPNVKSAGLVKPYHLIHSWVPPARAAPHEIFVE